MWDTLYLCYAWIANSSDVDLTTELRYFLSTNPMLHLFQTECRCDASTLARSWSTFINLTIHFVEIFPMSNLTWTIWCTRHSKCIVPQISVLAQFNSLMKWCREVHRCLRAWKQKLAFQISLHLHLVFIRRRLLVMGVKRIFVNLFTSYPL